MSVIRKKYNRINGAGRSKVDRTHGSVHWVAETLTSREDCWCNYASVLLLMSLFLHLFICFKVIHFVLQIHPSLSWVCWYYNAKFFERTCPSWVKPFYSTPHSFLSKHLTSSDLRDVPSRSWCSAQPLYQSFPMISHDSKEKAHPREHDPIIWLLPLLCSYHDHPFPCLLPY